MPTTRNTLVDYLHRPLTHITVQVLYTAIQNDVSLHKHPYSIYCIYPSLLILKFGYPSSNIVITSSPSSCSLILCITPLSLQSLTTYGHTITISESFAGVMKHTKNGYIYEFLILTLSHGSAANNI